MKKSLLFSVALASVMSVNAQQVSTVAMPTVSDDMVAAPMAERVGEVKMVSAKDGINFGHARVAAKAAGLKAEAPAKAFYSRPKGVTYYGMDFETYSLRYGFQVTPIYMPVTYTSLSSEAESLTWTYSNCELVYDESGTPVDYAVTEATGDVLDVTYTVADLAIPAPELLASNELGDSTYSATEYVSTYPYFEGQQGSNYMVTNVSPKAEIVAYSGLSVCNNADCNANLDQRFGLSAQGLTDVALYGLGEVFFYPGRPYLLTDVMFVACDLLRNGTLNATLEIYKVTTDEAGEIVEMGEKIVTANNDPSVIVADRQFQTVCFRELVYEDEETGRARDLIIDSDILVVVKPADAETSYASYIWGTEEDMPASVADLWNDHTTCYYMASGNLDGNQVVVPLSAGGAWYHDDTQTTIDVQRAYSFNLNAYNFYMYSEDTKFDAPNEGGSKTFNVESWFSSQAWDVTTAEGDELPEWIEISANDLTVSNGESEGYSGITEVTVTVPALEGEGRACDVVFSCYSASLTLHIAQGAAGVDGVEVSAAKVANVNGNFVVACDGASEVSVYNAAGALVKTAAINGESVINAQNLANGMYILKFNNNVIVKAVK